MLSVIIIAKNEEKKLPDCLRSVKWADLPAQAGEIIVIDTGSTDKTPSIAKKAGARVVKFTKGTFSDWRNKGLREAKGEWILYIDSDERVSKKLKKEILSIINDRSSTINSAYVIPRRNIIFGKEFKHGGQYPDYVKRLFLRSKLKIWEGDLHEEPVFEGELGYLINSLIHIKHDNLHDMIEKTNRWSETEANLMFDANHPKMNVIRFCTAIFREFSLRFIKQKAFLDGYEGVIYGIYQVYSRFISYAKLWEIQLKNNKI
ncbi:glycosyltransferase family 2 protein [Candidatus Woesebacteria bacterium]|nr:glycosyltransferase family 2 protein [Candidatus Woesebacteria bacterium]